MITSDDFSALIVTRANNPSRLEYIIQRIRKFYPNLQIVIVFDKVSPCLTTTDDNIIQIETLNRVYVSAGYNLALKHSTKPYFVFLHDDTIIAENFLEEIAPYVNENTFGNFITIEPPKYDNTDSELRPIQDFGYDINSFKENDFDIFCKDRVSKLTEKSKSNPYGGFFMSGNRDSLLKIGGFDEKFRPFFNEDSDLVIRMTLFGYKFVYCLASCVYHMASLTSRVDENEVLLSAQRTTKVFTKKWGISFDAFKIHTIDQNIPYNKINIKLEKINYDKTNPYHRFVKTFFDYDKTKPYSVAMLDFNLLSKNDIDTLSVLPYIIMQHMDKDLIHTNNFSVLINKKSIIPINVMANV